jgi:hypothetical protein
LAAELKKEPGTDVQVTNGSHGELTVSVDGREVARKQGDKMPTAEEVRSALRGKGATATH